MKLYSMLGSVWLNDMVKDGPWEHELGKINDKLG
jgi:hypothetical protein